MSNSNTHRITLALAACERLSDEELAQRGADGYRKMRDRKRYYAAAARTIQAIGQKLLSDNKKLSDEIASLKKQLAQAKSQIETLEQLDKPITDTGLASSMLAGIMSKPDAAAE